MCFSGQQEVEEHLVIIAPLGRRPLGHHRRLIDVTLVAVKGLSRCWLVGGCVLPGEDFFT